MLDLKRTLDLVRGALLDPEPTWRAYLPEADDLRRTVLLLTGPLIVASALVGYLLGLVFGGAALLGRPTFGAMLLGIVMMAVAIALVAFVFSFMANMFGGRMGFPRSLAAMTLAFVPGYVGSAISPLPWIGWLLSIALFIYALVLLWRILPIYLEAPVNSRGGYYVVSLIVCIVVGAIVNITIGGMLYGGAGLTGAGDFPRTSQTSVGGRGIAGQAAVLAAAAEDTYTPPSDGRLTEQQVQTFARVMQRTAELQAEAQERLRAIGERAENEERLSFRDFAEVMRGVTEVAGIQAIEAEVVKTGGGNWAEHQWVGETLRAAWIQRSGSPAIEHNYALYQKYEGQIAESIAH